MSRFLVDLLVNLNEPVSLLTDPLLARTTWGYGHRNS